MSSSCFVGRGSLLVSILGASRGFFTLSGESEITLTLGEDNESIFDARSGANERIDWYVRNYRVTLSAECFRIEKDAIALLLKANYARLGVSGNFPLPNPLTIGQDYILTPNIVPGSVVVNNAVAGIVPSTDYTVDEIYGLINFNATVSAQPYTVDLATTGHDSFALNGVNHVFVQALFKGLDKASNRKVMAHFYRLALDVSEAFKLASKEFSSLPIRMQVTPDLTQPLDATLGQYGRIMLL